MWPWGSYDNNAPKGQGDDEQNNGANEQKSPLPVPVNPLLPADRLKPRLGPGKIVFVPDSSKRVGDSITLATVNNYLE